MAKRWTHTSAFAHFGVKPRNVQWSWSGRSESGDVIVTLWQDQFEKAADGCLSYTRSPLGVNENDTRPGFRELMENLQYAVGHRDGRFKVIIAVAKDKAAHPRSIERCFPSNMVMRLVSFDRSEGSFTAKQEAKVEA